MNDRLMTFNEAKQYLQTSRATLYRFATAGLIPAVKMVGRWRFRKSRLDAWLDSQENTNKAVPKKRKIKAHV